MGRVIRNPIEKVYRIDPSVNIITEGFGIILEMARDLLKNIVVRKLLADFLTDIAALSH
jgi:hypothetical protein